MVSDEIKEKAGLDNKVELEWSDEKGGYVNSKGKVANVEAIGKPTNLNVGYKEYYSWSCNDGPYGGRFTGGGPELTDINLYCSEKVLKQATHYSLGAESRTAISDASSEGYKHYTDKVPVILFKRQRRAKRKN